MNNLRKWEALFLPSKRHIQNKPKSHSGHCAANNGNSRKQQQKNLPHRTRVGNLPRQPLPQNTRAGRERAESAPPAALRRDPGGPGAAAHTLVPTLAAPIDEPRPEGHEEVVRGIGWGPRKIALARRGRLHRDGYTKREGKFAVVAG